jgi:hypothetical protein
LPAEDESSEIEVGHICRGGHFSDSGPLKSFFKELEKIDVLSDTLDKRMEELVAEERKSQSLKQKIEYYSTPEGIARLAREQFTLYFQASHVQDRNNLERVLQ